MNLRFFVSAAVAVSAVIGIGTASAADLPARTYTKAPAVVPPPVINWTGLYIGVEGGGGWGRDNWFYPTPVTFTNHNISGGVAGGVIGYNWQAPGTNWVFGVEGNLDWAHLSGSGTCPTATFSCYSNLDSLFTATGRIGYAWSSALLYVKGGGAWTRDNDRVYTIATGALFSSSNNDRSGYTVGAGLEYMFAPNWSAKIEYDYADFGTSHMQLITPAGAIDTAGGTDVRLSVNTVKAGINYHFNWASPVVAKY
jgi:outer membrane immunogenic protein